MHTPRVVSYEQTTDECIAVKIRCCDNPKTDSVRTISQVHTLTKEQIKSMVDEHHKTVASKCAGMQATFENLQILTGLTHGPEDVKVEAGVTMPYATTIKPKSLK